MKLYITGLLLFKLYITAGLEINASKLLVEISICLNFASD